MSSKKHSDSKFVKCPFFHAQDPIKIFCEGIEAGNTIHLAFRTCDDRRRYMKRFCNCNFKTCKLYNIIDSKYDDNGNL